MPLGCPPKELHGFTGDGAKHGCDGLGAAVREGGSDNGGLDAQLGEGAGGRLDADEAVGLSQV